MRLHPRLISYLAETIVADLLREGMVAVDDSDRISAVIGNIITEDMEREE